MIINGVTSPLSNNQLALHPDSTLKKSAISEAIAKTYVVRIGIYHKKKGPDNTIWFENEISTINDK